MSIQGLFYRKRAIITNGVSFFLILLKNTIPLAVSAASCQCVGYRLVMASWCFVSGMQVLHHRGLAIE
jgi:hypothetical protein